MFEKFGHTGSNWVNNSSGHLAVLLYDAQFFFVVDIYTKQDNHMSTIGIQSYAAIANPTASVCSLCFRRDDNCNMAILGLSQK